MLSPGVRNDGSTWVFDQTTEGGASQHRPRPVRSPSTQKLTRKPTRSESVESEFVTELPGIGPIDG